MGRTATAAFWVVGGAAIYCLTLLFIRLGWYG